ncbi:hypothetical protein FMEXI_12846 [Fusarium mexicanum]|uniref:Zn(2)-C6 fungal-type domain-containing protein n=1 Tax=Fusarium mexicanum TaxID=751941 RepID=A0A8H5ML04_9HYPO|nr:hypothetical protein FMEXI_12846 [Fusarium mexicanum]
MLAHITGLLVQDLDEFFHHFHQTDDVWDSHFLSFVFFAHRGTVNPIRPQLPEGLADRLQSLGTKRVALVDQSKLELDALTEGPYFATATGLLPVRKLFSDTHAAFVASLVQSPCQTIEYSNATTADTCPNQAIAVPFRAYFTPSHEKPLNSLGVGIKENIDIAGATTFASSLAYGKFHGIKSQHTFATQRFLDLGVVILRNKDMGQFTDAEVLPVTLSTFMLPGTLAAVGFLEWKESHPDSEAFMEYFKNFFCNYIVWGQSKERSAFRNEYQAKFRRPSYANTLCRFCYELGSNLTEQHLSNLQSKRQKFEVFIQAILGEIKLRLRRSSFLSLFDATNADQKLSNEDESGWGLRPTFQTPMAGQPEIVFPALITYRKPHNPGLVTLSNYYSPFTFSRSVNNWPMFAQFELYSGGWVHAEERVKHRRSPGGCIPCQKRRKICDERRPTCDSCSSRRVACNWHSNDERRSQKLLSRAGERGLSPRDSNEEISTPEAPSDQLILRNGSRLSSPIHTNNTGAFNECFQGLPSCSTTGLLEVLDQATSRLDQGREFSMLAQGFEALANSRSMLHAWLACSAIIISDALKQIRLSPRSEESLTQDSNIATVLLRHIFEEFANSATDSLKYPSVTAPLCLALDQPPQNTHQALVLETLIYHIAINSVFRPSYLRNYHDLSKIIALWSRSPVLQSDANFRGFVKAGLSAWLPIELFDILFKASHLLHHRLSVVPNDMQARLRELRSRLNECQVELGQIATITGQNFSSATHDIESFHVKSVYSLAIELLITKLETPFPGAGEPLVINLCETALHHLARVRSDFTSLLWAITVLGTGMTTTKAKTSSSSTLRP